MTTEEILILAGVIVVVLVVLGAAIWLFSSRQRKRQQRLRERYGREYDAMVDTKGRRAGEEDLDSREQERRDFELRDPGESVRAELRERMAALQFRFVEEPREVLLEVQRAVTDGLRARGYPVAEDRDRALRLLSVDHPQETPPLRALLGGNYGHDIDNLRRLFLDARAALLDVVDVSYTDRDLAAAPASGERERAPGRERGREPEPRREPQPRREPEPHREPEPGPEPAGGPQGAYKAGTSRPNEGRT